MSFFDKTAETKEQDDKMAVMLTQQMQAMQKKMDEIFEDMNKHKETQTGTV